MTLISLLLIFLAATREAWFRNLLIMLRISFSWVAFLRVIFPSKGRRVISSAGFFWGFGPVVCTLLAAMLAQVRADVLGGVIVAGFVWMVF